MAIPFLLPEEDDTVRQHNATGGHPGTGSSGSGGGGNGSGPSASAGTSAIVVGLGSPSGIGSIPIPVSPGPLPSGTSTAVQTPLIGPMNGEQLVQIFCEALQRLSRGDTPSTPISQSPQSSSCSPFTTGYYTSGPVTGGQVFFPSTPNGVPPRTPTTPAMGGRALFFGQPPTPSPSGSSSHSSQHSANSSLRLDGTPASCSVATPIFHRFSSGFSGIGVSSSLITPTSGSTVANNGGATWPDEGDDSSESDSSQPSSLSSSGGEGAVGGGSSSSSGNHGAIGCSSHCLGLGHHHHPHLHHQQQLVDVGGGISTGSESIPPHLDFMAGREQLQEFAGKIPQRKKKSKPSKSKKSRTLMWPTLAVTATLIALGCGLLAAR